MNVTKTEENLYKAFVGEAKASLRLQGYALRATQDGYGQIAKLFRAISQAEKVHAINHLKILKTIKSTEENLQASFESEKTVSENIYPEFIKVAEEEENRSARISFSHARDAEGFHKKLYKNAMEHMLEEKEVDYHVCRICGYVADNQVPEQCPVCGAKPEMFETVA